MEQRYLFDFCSEDSSSQETAISSGEEDLLRSVGLSMEGNLKNYSLGSLLPSDDEGSVTPDGNSLNRSVSGSAERLTRQVDSNAALIRSLLSELEAKQLLL